jgi:hypothetical protein
VRDRTAGAPDATATRHPLSYRSTAKVSNGRWREATYWLRICAALDLAPAADLRYLIDEADQISRIPGSIVVKTKLRMRVGYAVCAFLILNFAF